MATLVRTLTQYVQMLKPFIYKFLLAGAVFSRGSKY